MDSDMIEVVPPESVPAPEVVAESGGLRSPPDSNDAMNDGSDSELSELGEDPEEDIGEVIPDHYEDGVPVFIPPMAQFKSFKLYMNKINQYGMQSGIVKVIPPPEWRDHRPALDEAIKTIRVKEPIMQEIAGQSGRYRQTNLVHQRSYNLPQWRQLCEQSEHQPPAKRGERRANQEKAPRPAPKPRVRTTPSGGKKKGRSTKGAAKKTKTKAVAVEEDEGTPDRLPTPVSPAIKPENDMDSVKNETDDEDGCTVKRTNGRQPKATTVGARRKFNRREGAGKVDEEAFKDFKYELEGEDFSKERCDELERAYWKTLTYASPLYGADMPGSLFDDRTTSWNLGKLENLLDVMGTKIPGVNTAYLYLGMWKATFAWHLEDVDLYSINIVHFGAPKQWYSISQRDARRFEAAMKNIFPTDAKDCDQFLRHKTFLISPSKLLQDYGIKVNKTVAHPGEFVITFPYGYHSGYNLGYNCAEAVNFALDSWLEFGRVAKKCECAQAQDSVWIDVREIERKMRGEETEYEETEDEEEEEEDDGPTDLPTPPETSGDNKVKLVIKKRKRPPTDKDGKSNIKRIRVRIKFPTKEPCCLCPNDIPSEPLLPTDDGRKAHRICALYMPETSLEVNQANGTEKAVDIKYIDKDRLELKCNYCRSKKGACFQCSHKKCTRAYHATCAAAAGVFVEQGEIPVFGEDGTEYKDDAIEFSCRFHRSKRDKKLDSQSLGADSKIRKAASEMAEGAVCQMQYLKGDIFAGLLVENRKEEEMLLVDILPKGDRLEVDYKWLLVPSESDFRLPKPSAHAIQMPKTRKEKLDLNTSKRMADDLPRTDDIFLEGYTWAEFKAENLPKNPAQVKIDFKKDNQIWYYLGKNSTEAKAQFTEDPAKPRDNRKGYFLDTVDRAPIVAPRQSYAASYPAKVNYHALNASKVTKPSPLSNSSRPEKPYVYKPRLSNDSYRVDSQAYRSQQNFLQRSTPSYSAPKPVGYAFGTDPNPRWKQSDTRTGTASSPGAHPSGKTPPMASPAQYHNSQIPKSNNPFSGRPQSSSSTPKYTPHRSTFNHPWGNCAYFEIEYNRMSSEYKSPYRPGGGFMNGYQGDYYAHHLQTLFQKNKGSSTVSSSSLPSHGSLQRTSYSPSQPSPSTPSAASFLPKFGGSSSGSSVKYGSYSSQQVSKSAAQQLWEKKDSPQLHPAIRQEYNPMFHHQYQSSRESQSSQSRNSQQPHSSQSQPLLYAPNPRTIQQRSEILMAPNPRLAQPGQDARYYAPQPRYNGPLAPPQPYAPPYQPGLLSNPPPTNHYPYPYPNIPQPPIPTLTPQPKPQYKPPPRAESQGSKSSQEENGSTSQSRPQSSSQESTWVPPSQRYQQYAASQQENESMHREEKPVYAHQQYFQKPHVALPQPRDFADVPADTTSLVEKMIANLKRTTAASSRQ